MSSLQKTVMKSRLPPLNPLSREPKKFPCHRRDYTPVEWSKYFERTSDVEVNGNNFRVYSSGTNGPLLVLLHGGGFSALSWALFSASVSTMVNCQTLAIDLRGHGDSVTTADDDLSAETMSNDIGEVLARIYNNEEPPPIVLIGHSMGGAIAVHTASRNLIPSLIGLAVIDVVEGTALDALTSMQSFLRGRPKEFDTIERAIEWCVRSGQVRNAESAKVSMPGQIKNKETNQLATNEVGSYIPSSTLGCETIRSLSSSDSIEEVEQDEMEESNNHKEPFKEPSAKESTTSSTLKGNGKYVWRIDLAKTEKYWAGWFQGLSNTFLNCTVPKMLLLAGIDRLDKNLMVGQMQGKFQMQVLPHCGHAVHEDVPDKVAEVVATFLFRHKFAEAGANFVRTFPAC